jgi:hypothetical protein
MGSDTAGLVVCCVTDPTQPGYGPWLLMLSGEPAAPLIMQMQPLHGS